MFKTTNIYLLSFALLLGILNSQIIVDTLNYRPVIGILSVPSEFPDVYPSSNYSYVVSSYVKFAEAGGARAVPIQYDLPTSQLQTLLGYLNGFIITDSDQEILNSNGQLTQYAQTVQYILNWAINQNNAGNYTPVWGTDAAINFMAYMIAGSESFLMTYNGTQDIATTLNFFDYQFNNSRTFQNFPSDLLDLLETEDLVYYDFETAPYYSAWTTVPKLESMFSIIAASHDSIGNQFSAYIEADDYPLYLSQFHPESVAFEWNELLNIPHDFNAIRFEQWLGNFFANETRKNWNQFPNETYAALFIFDSFNYTILPNAPYNTLYFFENVNWTNNTNTTVPPNTNPSVFSSVNSACSQGLCAL